MPRKPVGRKVARKKTTIGGYGAYRKKTTYRGYGAYKADKPRKGYGSRLGKTLGEGADILYDQLLQNGGLGKLLGFGDYVTAPWSADIKSNTLGMGQDPPVIQNSSMKNVIIRHREYLGDVITGAAGVFTNRAYSINPGVAETFPWLSQIACCFEQYKLRGCIFEFKSTSADALNSTNTALGTIIMATEYDVTRPDFSSKQQMENHQYAMSARQSCSMLHPIECARSENVLNELYVRAGSDSGKDYRFTDFGDFQIATVGQQGANVNIGELWVTYEVELLKPRFATVEGPGAVMTQHLQSTTGIAPAYPFGTVTSSRGNLTLDIQANKLVFPDWLDSGRFLISFVIKGGAGPITAPGVTVSRCTLIPIWSGVVTYVATTGINSDIFMFSAILDINDAAAELSFIGGAYPNPAASMDFFITSYNPVATIEASADDEAKVEEVTPQDLIEQLLQTGVPLSDLHKMLSDKAFVPDKKSVKEDKEFKTEKKEDDLSKSQTESIQDLIERVRNRRANK